MRAGITSQVQDTLNSGTIVTAMAARLDFQSETLLVWTGASTIQANGSGDTLLDGNVFQPFAQGVPVDVGENSFSLSGSAEFQMSIAIPSDAGTGITASQVYPSEYQGRPATVWRVFLVPQADPLAAPIWIFRRIRSGAMDKVEITNDGSTNKFTLTIESHQSSITNATNQTWLDQRKYDPNDSSQDFAVSIANGDPAPSKGSNAGAGLGLLDGLNYSNKLGGMFGINNR
jgi:hypothetical protein